MNFCLIEQEVNQSKFLLATLISIDFLYKNYNILIACSDKTKEYLLNFPLKYNGNITWLILDNLDDNNIRYPKNMIIAMNNAVELFGEALFIDYRVDIINKIHISDEIKTQGIGFVSRSVDYIATNIEQKYILDILYINDVKYLNIIDNLYRGNIDEWANFSVDNYSNDELREINKKIVIFNIKLSTIIKNECNLDKFFPHETLISTEDFFAYNNKLQLKDITLKWEIPKNLVTERIKVLEEVKKEDTSLINISCLNIRSTQVDKEIVLINKEIYSRMANYNIIYMLLINLKYSKRKIEFVMPKREGIGIWDRKDDPPGLYELIDMITKDNVYFDKIYMPLDYFSFTNFIITDKPSHYWLNNNITKYSGFFICNYDDTLDTAINKINIPSQFGFYYSDYPKLLEEYSQEDTEKSRFCIEIYKDKIIEYELSEDQISLHKKKIIIINTPEEKLQIIAETTFVLFDNVDINQLANCFGLKAVPVLNNTCISNFKDKNIYMLNCDTNYIVEPINWDAAINNREIIIENNNKFYNEHVMYDKILNIILKNFFDICYERFSS
jgi:hypothetical protein